MAHEGRRVAAQWGVQAPSQRVGHLDTSIEQLWSQEDRVSLTPKTGQRQSLKLYTATMTLE